MTLIFTDSPTISWIVKSHRNICLRLHGREGRYSYEYNVSEFEKLA